MTFASARICRRSKHACTSFTTRTSFVCVQLDSDQAPPCNKAATALLKWERKLRTSTLVVREEGGLQTARLEIIPDIDNLQLSLIQALKQQNRRRLWSFVATNMGASHEGVEVDDSDALQVQVWTICDTKLVAECPRIDNGSTLQTTNSNSHAPSIKIYSSHE